MSDDWDFYFCTVDHNPASIFLDLGIKDEASFEGFGDLVWLRLYMRNPREDGLSSNAEFEALKEIEDHINDTFRSLSDRVVYVGRNTSDGCRDFYFYAPDGPAIETA